MDKTDALKRTEAIKKAGVIGIVINALLAGFKITLGTIANSVAVVSDGLNNFSDCITSVITAASAKLAEKAPNRRHPHGYGRVEYIAAFSVSMLIIITGINLLRESGERIFHPEETSVTIVSILILAVSVIVKIMLSRYQLRTGKKYHSDALSASGREAVMDVIQSAATLACIAVLRFTNLNLDAYLGVIISIAMIKTGNDMLREGFDALIGVRQETELSKGIQSCILAQRGVKDVFHVVLHNYGPLNKVGSACISLDDRMTVGEAAAITERTRRAVLNQFGITMTFEIHSENQSDAEAVEVRTFCEQEIMGLAGTRKIHGFYYSKERNEICFNVDVDYSVKNYREYRKTLSDRIHVCYPDTAVIINVAPE